MYSELLGEVNIFKKIYLGKVKKSLSHHLSTAFSGASQGRVDSDQSSKGAWGGEPASRLPWGL